MRTLFPHGLLTGGQPNGVGVPGTAILFGAGNQSDLFADGGQLTQVQLETPEAFWIISNISAAGNGTTFEFYHALVGIGSSPGVYGTPATPIVSIDTGAITGSHIIAVHPTLTVVPGADVVVTVPMPSVWILSIARQGAGGPTMGIELADVMHS